MTGIVEFITARLDEDQADAEAAQAADPAPWSADVSDDASTPERYGHGAGLVIAVDEVALWDCEGSNSLCMTAATARHIARHDPARVLAEVKAKRAVVALHVSITKVAFDRDDEPVVDGGYCGFCQSTDGFPDGDWPCDTLKLFAAPFNQHPDYDPAWRVE